jgi:O-antigen ligase/tetratricopeptide (TPR) repeat protein
MLHGVQPVMEERETIATALLSCFRFGQDIGWLLLIVLPPLTVNLWGQQPFELPKVTLVRTLVWALAGFTLIDCVLTRRSLRRRLLPKPMVLPVAVWATWVVVTTVTAIDWRLSIWGSYERSQGSITLLTYLLSFLLAVDHFRSLARARQLVTAMVAASVPLILFSLGQAAGWNAFGLVSDARSPMYATLGRANFVGAYLSITAPLALALLLTTQQRGLRLLWSIVFTGQLLVVGLAFARSAWIALAVSLSVFSLLWWGPRIARRYRMLAWGSVALLFLSGPLTVLWLGQRQVGSTAARLAIWQGALKLVQQRPWIGYGPDALGVVFPRVYPPELVYYQGREYFVDRAHNLFLDTAVAAGIPGVLAFSLVLFTFLIVVGRALRIEQRPNRRVLLIAILSAIMGNTANNLVSFDVTSTAAATWVLTGLGVALTAVPAAVGNAIMPKRGFARWSLAGLLSIGIALAIWQANVRPLLADIAARSAHRSSQVGDWRRAITAGEQAVLHWPVEPAHHLLLSQSYWRQALAEPATASIWFSRAESALGTARELRPADPTIWLHTAQFYTSLGSQFGANTRDLAEYAYGRAVALAPNHATIYTEWGRTYLEEGTPERAASLLRRAVMLDASNGDAYLYLGAAELALGRLEIALADYREAIRLLPESGQAYAGLAQCYWELGQPEQALLAAEQALQRDPQNALAMALLRKIGNSP